MKIKTITCHDVYNTGASLQAYALARYLREQGHDVQIIDYKPDYLSGHFRLWGGVNPVYNRPFLREAYCLAKFPGRLQRRLGNRKKNFDRFRRDNLPLTRRYHSYDDLVADPPEAEVYLAGSDQIWNTFFQNGRDPAFYLTFAPKGTMKAAYAASFATEQIEPGWEQQVTEWIAALEHVSVREVSGLALLEQLGISGGQAVLDPVFLLGRNDWEEICPSRKEKKPYILVYDFDGNPEIRLAAEKLKLQTGAEICSLQKLAYADHCRPDAGPLEFLSLVRHAEVVLSNSFHATAFALIFQREFWVFHRNEQINTRMRDLTLLAGVSERLVTDGTAVEGGMQIDFEGVQQRLDAEIQKSKDYLERVTGDIR